MLGKAYLTDREVFCYGIGDAGQAIMGTLISFYQLFYFTDVMRLSLPSVAGLFLLTKFIDTISYPVFGFILDRSRGGVGAFLRWRIWLIAPFFGASVLLFTFDHNWNMATRLAYAYIVLSVFVLLSALISVVYSGLISAISLQARDRARLSSVRFIFAFGAGTVATFSVHYLVDAFGGKDGGGFQTVAFIFSMFAAFALYLTGSATRQRSPEGREVPPKTLRATLNIFKYPNFLAPIAASFFTGLFVVFKAQMAIYFISYVMRRDDIMGVMLAGGTLSSAIGVSLTWLVITRINRRILYVVLMLANSFFIFVVFLTKPTDISTIIILHCVNSALGGASAPVIFSIYSDVVDYFDDQLSLRAPAFVNAIAMLAGRIGSSLGMVLTPLCLAFFHYRPNAPQTAESSFGIVLMFTIVPAVLAALSALAMLPYSLTNRSSDDISVRLMARKAEIGRPTGIEKSNEGPNLNDHNLKGGHLM